MKKIKKLALNPEMEVRVQRKEDLLYGFPADLLAFSELLGLDGFEQPDALLDDGLEVGLVFGGLGLRLALRLAGAALSHGGHRQW